MATRMRDAMSEQRDALRYEPIEKRIRALVGPDAVVDSSRAVLVWEPRRVVPSFAVPIEDVRGELVPAPVEDGAQAPVLHPGIAFAAHSTGGESLSLRAGDTDARGRRLRAGRPRPGRPRDPRLRGLRRLARGG